MKHFASNPLELRCIWNDVWNDIIIALLRGKDDPAAVS